MIAVAPRGRRSARHERALHAARASMVSSAAMMNRCRTTTLPVLMLLAAIAGTTGCGASQQQIDPSCDQSCVTDGACTGGKGGCIATRDEDCRQSALCPGEGRCVAKKGLCVADSDEDCSKSEACKTKGLCKVRAGSCVATTEAAAE